MKRVVVAGRLAGLGFFLFLTSASAPAAPAPADGPQLANTRFQVAFDKRNGAVAAIRHPGDERLNFVLGAGEHTQLDVKDSRWLGDLLLRYRSGSGPWRLATTGLSADSRRVLPSQDGGRIDVRHSGNSRDPRGIKGLAVDETWRLDGNGLVWTLTIHNRTKDRVALGDLGLPLPFNSKYVRDTRTTYEERVVRHHQIAGDNSFVLLTRADGTGPYLLMTPVAGTRLEYFDRATPSGRANADPAIFAQRMDRASSWEGLFTAYVHASVQAREIETRGSWNQPLTSSRLLASAGLQGDTVVYGFRFDWAEDYAVARRLLVSHGRLDVETAPGMVIPTDLSALVSIGAKSAIEEVTAEYPGETIVEAVPSPNPARRNWRFKFKRLGENKVRIRWGGGRETSLEYFVTEPLDVLIAKRSALLVRNQQVRDPSKWYDGLFSLWDMQEGKLRTPDNQGGLATYAVSGSDDPDLGKAPYVAAKNLAYPDAGEIAAVEYYLEHFVWGKLQRTDKELPFPYGIYVSDSWKANRFSDIGYGSGGIGREHLWRTFDYTHLIRLYLQMYRMARAYPELVHYLKAHAYLERAYGTAMAFFEVPYQIKIGPMWNFKGWTDWAYKQGAFHELHIPPLIDALERGGRTAEAAKLRGEWEKKVKYFAYDDPYPFASEMYFDTTAYQSTHAQARYGLENEIKPDKDLWRDKNNGVIYSHPVIRSADFTRLMTRSIAANIAARGWLESSYYQLGSDYRQDGSASYTLSYMTQMGGAPILDHALTDNSPDAPALMRLGYASYLGSWALVYSGTPESGYGYWYKGAHNDGAASWNFKPEKYVPVFAGPTFAQGRGGWRVDGEIDNGFSDALLTAATVVTEDPLFGQIALGGDLAVVADAIRVTPKDGIGQRIHVRTNQQRLDLTLDRDGSSSQAPVTIAQRGKVISFRLENRYRTPHETIATLRGLSPGRHRLTVANTARTLVVRKGQDSLLLPLRVGADFAYDISLKRIGA